MIDFNYLLVIGIFSINIICSFYLTFKHYMKKNTIQEFKLSMASFTGSVLLYSSLYIALTGGLF
jgi:hypothetical protein